MNLANNFFLSAYQKKGEAGSVYCQICPHNCLIHEGKNGICRTRINRGGTLYSIAYGNPCSISVDPIEKKPLFHFMPGEKIFSIATAGCNFRCLNCQNWQISQSSPDKLNSCDFSPDEIVYQAVASHTKLIAFTYTEPTVFYEYMFDIAKIAHEKGLKTVMISNGFINTQPLLDLISYLNGANIDLKCFDQASYLKLTGGKLRPVLNTLKTLKENNVWLEITNLLIPTFNDNPEQIKRMCTWLVDNGFADTPLHFSRFFPTYKLTEIAPTSKDLLIQAKSIAEDTGIKFVYIGNMPHLNGENTSCPRCKNLLIKREGFLVMENQLSENGCKFCGEIIPGVWN
jgi:pyruvate formate lyase activating enzyme